MHVRPRLRTARPPSISATGACIVSRSLRKSAGRRATQGPSLPEAVHERGSQGASGSTDAVGALNAPLASVVVDVDVDDGGVVVVEVDRWPVLVVVGKVVVGLTENSVPVVTVTCAPSVVGPYAMITAPDIESATAWAAASSDAVLRRPAPRTTPCPKDRIPPAGDRRDCGLRLQVTGGLLLLR